MDTLLDDYKRKLKTVNELISSNKNNGSIMDEKRAERLNTKVSEYRSFIADIERVIERTKANASNPNLTLGDINGLVLEQIREAFADYYKSEGCSCCRNQAKHDDAEKRLANLLKPDMYEDASGYNWYLYASKDL